MSDDLPDTKRTPVEERLAEALRVIADILEESKAETAKSIGAVETSMINAIGRVAAQQERDYGRVTRIDEQNAVQMRSIDSGISKILTLLEPISGRLDNLVSRVADLEKKASNGTAAHQ